MKKFHAFLESLTEDKNSVLIGVIREGYNTWLEGVVRYKGFDFVTDLPVDFSHTDVIPLDHHNSKEILLQTAEKWQQKINSGNISDVELEILLSKRPKVIFNEITRLPISLAKSDKWKHLRKMAGLYLQDRIAELKDKKFNRSEVRAKSAAEEIKKSRSKRIVDPKVARDQAKYKKAKMQYHDEKLKKLFAENPA